MRSRRWPAGTGRQVQDRPFAFRRRAGAPAAPEVNEDEQGGASEAPRTSPAETTAQRGRKTGVLIRVHVSRDSSGMENLAEFWQQDGFESLEQDSSTAPGGTARRAHFPGAPSLVLASAKSCVIPSPIEEDALAETRGSDERLRSGGGGSSSSSSRSSSSSQRSRELSSTSQGSSLHSSTASWDSRRRQTAAPPASKAPKSALCTPSERRSAGSSDMDSCRSLRQDGGGSDQEVCRMLHVHLSVRGGNRPLEERLCWLTCMSATLFLSSASQRAP
jgi:hypothetical protein